MKRMPERKRRQADHEEQDREYESEVAIGRVSSLASDFHAWRHWDPTCGFVLRHSGEVE